VKRYMCVGKVRGCCPHFPFHTSILAAARCLARDRKSCEKLGGGSYSDRRIMASDAQGEVWRELSLEENEAAVAALGGEQ
jgi:hypothetical protein